MPDVRRGMERVYKRMAMEIIHWMIIQLEGMDLFANELNGTPAIIPGEDDEDEPTTSTNFPEVIDLTNCDLEELATVTPAILPRAAVEKAHLDVYDTSGPDHEMPPYRLTKRSYTLDSDAYHR